jgi:hypothetical protein
MWQLLVLCAALANDHGPEFRAGWERAKARAELYSRFRHGQISSKELTLGLAWHLTPKEEQAFRKQSEESLRRWEADTARREASIKKAKEEWERRKAKRLVGPPAPPDAK